MATTSDNRPLKILHVLTLNGRNGEYGGPVRVARELCHELNSRGHKTHIFSGALKGSEPQNQSGLSESFICVKPLVKSLKISSLWSWKLLIPLWKLIKQAEIIHIHFARDLIPFLAAFFSILNKKPFITQTHGMINSDYQFAIKVIDLLFTRRLLNQSVVNLVLTVDELRSIEEFSANVQSKILQNGIKINNYVQSRKKERNNITFCARLDRRKGVDKFIDLAIFFKDSELKFKIYGPDGGELGRVQAAIQSEGIHGNLEYKGALKSENVHDALLNSDLLILPSRDEPFPMVVLEALAVGTPVLVMPSCGISQILKEFNPNFVAKSEDLEGLISQTNFWKNSHLSDTLSFEIVNFCKEKFGIESIVTQLTRVYSSSITSQIDLSKAFDQ